MKLINAPKGTEDVPLSEAYKWHWLEAIARERFALAGYREIRLPTFEQTELFARGVGDTTDIVQKEMYTFEDKGGRSMTLRPESTAGAVRSYIQNGLANEPMPLKEYYLGMDIFRYDRPQAGRLREHHQLGVEVFGAASADMDAEVIALGWGLFEQLGVTGLTLYINSIGCPDCRPKYNEALKRFLTEREEELCPTCRDRIGRNPLRVLDCKEERCQRLLENAPLLTDYICEKCDGHFSELKKHLTLLGLPFEVDARLVRGQDYYTRTVFEIKSDALGAQSTVCGGGRYDILVEQMGGKPTPAIGFGCGMERLLIVLDKLGKLPVPPPLFDVFVASMGDAAHERAFTLTAELRQKGIKADCDHMSRSLKAQFKYADKMGASYVATIGDEELESGTARLKSLADGIEQTIKTEKIAEVIKNG